ncbi:MAG: SRPBCC domain-containing protein [Bdellovibrionota bacterium]
MQTSQERENQSSSNAQPIIIDRTFQVSVERLFEAFTSVEALKAWWWPKDMYADRIDLDFKEGGKYFINMKGYSQGGGGMTGEFEEIVPNKRIVMSDQFADENGKPISAKEAKMPGTWPEIIFITFEFNSANETSSTLHLFQSGIPAQAHDNCVQGWTQSFDKLEKFLNEGT